jgi:hypothetical protein
VTDGRRAVAAGVSLGLHRVVAERRERIAGQSEADAGR